MEAKHPILVTRDRSISRDDVLAIIISHVHPFLAPNILHLQSKFTLLLSLLDAQLLEVHVRVEKHVAGVSLARAFVAEEAIKRRGGAVNCAAQGGFRVAFAKVGVNLPADFIAGIVDGDIVYVFAVEHDARDVPFVFFVGTLLCNFLAGSLGELCTLLSDAIFGSSRGHHFFLFRLRHLPRQLNPGELSLLKEDQCRPVCLVAGSAVLFVASHEPPIGAAMDVEGLLELARLHLARIDELSDLAPDLTGALVDFVDFAFVLTGKTDRGRFNWLGGRRALFALGVWRLLLIRQQR